MTKVRNTLGAAALAILSLSGCAQPSMVEVRYPGPFAQKGQSGPPTVSTVEVDGASVTLAESTFTDGGKHVICRQYVKSIQRDMDQPEPKTTIDVGKSCDTSN